MDHHLPIVATGFRVAGIALGIPSLLALICLLWAWISLHSGVPAAGPATTGISNAGLVGLLMAGARIFAKAFGAFTALTSWAIAILSGVAAAAVLLSAVLFYTGRGLAAHAAWARIAGSLLTLAMLLISFGVLLTLRRTLALVTTLPIGVSLYSLWVLLRRFS